MRLLVRLDAARDATYNSTYHHKLRGVIWNALEESPYSALHGDRDTVPFSFSNPFPVSDMETDDRRNILIASPHDGLVEYLATQFTPSAEFNIGEMPFTVAGANIIGTDVGEPGTSGVLRTDTGLYIPLPKERWSQYGINPQVNADKVGWTHDYPVDILIERIRENLSWKHNQLKDDFLEGPADSTSLFTAYNHDKTYGIRVPVTTEPTYEYTFVVSKWEFEYTVRSPDHRRWLNLALDTGLGWRNSLGFGFTNKEQHDN